MVNCDQLLSTYTLDNIERLAVLEILEQKKLLTENFFTATNLNERVS